MKQAKVIKDSRNFGVKADWYNHDNLQYVEAANPTRVVGNKVWPAAYFVRVDEWVRDEMFGSDWQTVAYAGPFATEQWAKDWADAYNNCPF